MKLIKIGFGIILFLLSISPLNAANLSSDQEQDSKKTSTISILKADEIHGDRLNNTLDAIGNAELTRGDNVVYSDKMSYSKNDKMVKASGNVRIKNFQLGNLLASYADIKDDFNFGHFNDARLIFIDGSYVKSPLITRVNQDETILDKAIFSICPNPLIAEDNEQSGKLKDLFSLKSSRTTIDKKDDSIKIKNAVFRIYDVPVFYSPYVSTPLPSKKRKSGFLSPSYTESSKLGLGIIMPYYFNIAPDKDLTTTAQIHPINNHIILTNEYRQLLESGPYDIKLELANDKPLNNAANNIISNDDKKNQRARWHLKSDGDFKLSEKNNLGFAIDNVGDKSYLYDYHNSLIEYTVSEVNLERVDNRNYYAAKTVKIQELSPIKDDRDAPFALPILNSYIESKPGSFNQKYSLLSNGTAISRQDGLQYRRVSVAPKIDIPYNFMGNLFNASASVQTDLYNLSNAHKAGQVSDEFNKFAGNYRPEVALSWNLPLIKKLTSNTIIIQPMANFVSSSFYNNDNKIPNEDTNNNELTQNNLFLNDRFTGFDRNESGQRLSYGAKSSLYNSLGQFGLGLGQSFRRGVKKQDVKIRGFNENNISNIVGEISYKTEKVFRFVYNFHLNESNYRNDVNEIFSSVNLDMVNLFANYLFIRKTPDNPDERDQIDLGTQVKLTKSLSATFAVTRDLVTGSNISRRIGIMSNGCCVIYGFSVSESNPTNFVKSEQSYNILFTIKNL